MCARDAQPGMASESDESDLRERVDQLEATVEQQQATIKKMLPGRRGALKAGGLLAGGGLLGALGSDRAAAADGTQDTSAGTIGAAGDSTDIYLDQLLDPGGDEILNVDDTGNINAAFGRTWAFDNIAVQSTFSPDSIDVNSISTGETDSDLYRRSGTKGELREIVASEQTGPTPLSIDVDGSKYSTIAVSIDVRVEDGETLQMRLSGSTNAYGTLNLDKSNSLIDNQWNLLSTSGGAVTYNGTVILDDRPAGRWSMHHEFGWNSDVQIGNLQNVAFAGGCKIQSISSVEILGTANDPTVSVDAFR
jgi:hypothetical protein